MDIDPQKIIDTFIEHLKAEYPTGGDSLQAEVDQARRKLDRLAMDIAIAQHEARKAMWTDLLDHGSL